MNNTQPPVLLLGATGKVGTLLTAAWRHDRPTGPALLGQARRRNAGADLVWSHGDPVPDIAPVRAVVMLWGVTQPDEQALSLNTDLALAALDLARRLRADRILIASSAAVYAPGSDLLREADLHGTAPTAYGQAKRDMEHAVIRATKGIAHPPAICMMRIANVAGADSLFSALDINRRITLDRFPGGAGPVRSYIAPGDLVRAIAALVTCPVSQVPGAINLGGDRPLAMADLACAAGAEIEWRPAPPEAVERVALDNTRLTRLIGNLAVSSDAARTVADLNAVRACI